MLHAWKIVFPHPRSKIMRQHMAPLPDDFRAALAALELPLIGERQLPQDPPLDPDAEPGRLLTKTPVDLMDDVGDDDLLQSNDDRPENDDHSQNYDMDDLDDDEDQ